MIKISKNSTEEFFKSVTKFFKDYFTNVKTTHQFYGMLLGSHMQIKKRDDLCGYMVYTKNFENYSYINDIYKDLEGMLTDPYLFDTLILDEKQANNSNYVLQTFDHSYFLLLMFEFYNKAGKKIIPETIDNYMSEELITMLYLEQGYLEKRFTKNYYAFDLSHFDIECIKRLKDSLQYVLKIESKLNKKNKSIIIKNEDSILKLEHMMNIVMSNKYKLMKSKVDRIVLKRIKTEEDGIMQLINEGKWTFDSFPNKAHGIDGIIAACENKKNNEVD